MFATTKHTSSITLSKVAGHFCSRESGCSYHFNGQEGDNEIAGTGNIMTAEFWEYDTRLGRRWNCDPKPDISISIYSCFRNNPIRNIDVKGDTIGINLLAKNDAAFENAQILLSKLNGENDGVFIIVAHGSSMGMQIGKSIDGTKNKQVFDGEELTKEFRAACPALDEDFNAGKKITLMLYSCNTGNEKHSEVPIAKEIANTNENLTVIAPNAYIRTGKLGVYLNRHDDDEVQQLKFNVFKKDKDKKNDKFRSIFIGPIKPHSCF